MAAVALAQVTAAGVGDFFGVNGHHGAVDVAVHHRHHIVFDAVLVAFAFAANENLKSLIGAVACTELVVLVGDFKGATHPVDADLPKLGGHGFVHLLIADAFDFSFEVAANAEVAFHLLITLAPKAAAAVTGKAGIPGVAVVVGLSEEGTDVGARGDGSADAHDWWCRSCKALMGRSFCRCRQPTASTAALAPARVVTVGTR